MVFDVGNTLFHLDYAFIADALAAAGHAVDPMALRIAEYEAKAAVDRALLARAPDAAAIHLWRNDAIRRPSYFTTVLGAVGIPPAVAGDLLDALEAHNRERCLWRVMEPDTPAVLDALRARGYVLAVVSNADGRVEADLARAGLAPRFATIVDSHVVGVEKPARRIFELALERLDVPADAALYVGDLFGIDVVGARGAGMSAVLVDPLARYPVPEECLRIRRLGELLDLVPPAAANARP